MAGQPPPRLSREARGLAKTKEERTGARRRRKTGAAVKRERKALAAAQAAGSPPQALTPTLNPHVVAFVPDFSLDDAPRDWRRPAGAAPARDDDEADGNFEFLRLARTVFRPGPPAAADVGAADVPRAERGRVGVGRRGVRARARTSSSAAAAAGAPGPPGRRARRPSAAPARRARGARGGARGESRRRAWAVEAIAGEQRRRVSDTFLLETASTRWFEELVNAKTWDDDYEVVCPYACFGCGHACARSGLVAHLASCPARRRRATRP
ncbi:RNA uridylyltransferase [Aureococcus anophagefferens]|nr:RNA uridylyltransferase [Aureococcus anophagefferens]